MEEEAEEEEERCPVCSGCSGAMGDDTSAAYARTRTPKSRVLNQSVIW